MRSSMKTIWAKPLLMSELGGVYRVLVRSNVGSAKLINQKPIILKTVYSFEGIPPLGGNETPL